MTTSRSSTTVASDHSASTICVGAAECEDSDVISLTVECRVPLPDDDSLQDGELPMTTLLLQNLQVVDEICSGDLMLVGLSHMVEWRMLVKVHGHTSGQRGCSLPNVVHRFILKFATFNGACPVVDYVGPLQPVFSM